MSLNPWLQKSVLRYVLLTHASNSRMHMRTLLLFSFLVFSVCAFGQIQKKLQGSWKVIAIAGDELFYDFKKDSAVFDAGPGADTLRANALAAELFSQMGEGVFIFSRDGKLIQKFGGVAEEGFSYVIDEKTATIKTDGRRNGVLMKEIIKYQFKGEHLVLSFEEDDSPLHLTLERQK